MEEEREEINDSPIEQVRLTIPITDDTTLPVLTFRTWILGPTTCLFLAFLTQFSEFRQSKVIISSSCFQIILIPIGKLMAASLPTTPVRIPGTSWTFSMNPGPFNIKEHVLISILTSAGQDNPYSLTLVTIVKAFYHRNLNFFAAFFLVLTTQMMGYGFVGLFTKFLVDSPYMWWPSSLPDVTFYRSLHEVELRRKGHLTRLQFFIIVSISSFAYYVIPNYFFPSITALSFVCWIWKDSVTAHQIGSGLHGLGIGSFSLDWATLSTFLGNPLAYPMVTIMNQMVGFILILYILSPIAYWTNSYNAKRFPFHSSELFDFDGQTYNVSRVMDKDLKFSQERYNNYSKIYLSIVFLYSNGFDFGTLTATITHFVLFHGREAWLQFKQAYKNEEQFGDVHNRLMKKYDSVPQWWFYVILFMMIGLSIFTCERFEKQLQLPSWGVLLACLLILVLLLPIGVLLATTGQSMYLFTTSELIIGYLYPGKPLANLAFKSYSFSTMYHATSFMYNSKLAHYMKIPPKSMFTIQIVGGLLSSSINFTIAWWILSSVKNICDVEKLPKGSPWTCPGGQVVNSMTTIWGTVGPSLMFAPHGLYSKIYIFFLIGLLATMLVWFLARLFPEKKWIRLIHIPNIFAGASALPPAGAVHYWSWFTVGVLFNFVVYRKYTGWWAKYNYVLSNGLDVGVAFMAVLASLTLNIKDIYGMNWWGLEVGDHCPLATCPTAPGVKAQGCSVFH